MMALTQERLRKVIHYNPETGAMRRIRTRNPTGSLNTDGYLTVYVDGKRYQAHRLAWLYVNGSFPADCIDHKNGIKTDNRIENLRPATKSQNSMNSKVAVNNSTGFKNVSRNRGGYFVSITLNHRHHTKWFKEMESAIAFASSLRRELHGEFACGGHP